MHANPLEAALDIRCANLEAALLGLLRHFADGSPDGVCVSVEARQLPGVPSAEIDLAVSVGDVPLFGCSL